MAGQGRPRDIRFLGTCCGTLLAFVLAPTSSAAPRPQDQAVLPAMEDAELADVCFVDAQRGWAVGDRGVIWHTADGGRRWQLLFSRAKIVRAATERLTALSACSG